MDRFQEPTSEDEYHDCNGCGRTMNYEKLDDDGLCKDCRPESESEV